MWSTHSSVTQPASPVRETSGNGTKPSRQSDRRGCKCSAFIALPLPNLPPGGGNLPSTPGAVLLSTAAWGPSNGKRGEFLLPGTLGYRKLRSWGLSSPGAAIPCCCRIPGNWLRTPHLKPPSKPPTPRARSSARGQVEQNCRAAKSALRRPQRIDCQGSHGHWSTGMKSTS